jgi:predicted transposase YbfD/YdcC
VELAHARSLIIVHKTTTSLATGSQSASRQVYLSSLPPVKGCAENFATLIRGHWGGSENRNHWVRDHIFREDDTRSKNWKLNANLAVTRAGLLNLKARLLPDKSWTEIRQNAQCKTGFASNLIGKRPHK